jgi:hypothetical protein
MPLFEELEQMIEIRNSKNKVNKICSTIPIINKKVQCHLIKYGQYRLPILVITA